MPGLSLDDYIRSFQINETLVVPNQNLEEIEEKWVGKKDNDSAILLSGEYSSDLARLYYVGFLAEEESFYKKNGEEILKELYNSYAKEVMGDIERVIFQDDDGSEYGLYGRNELWKDITPFNAECMTYEEAVSWLEAQID